MESWQVPYGAAVFSLLAVFAHPCVSSWYLITTQCDQYKHHIWRIQYLKCAVKKHRIQTSWTQWAGILFLKSGCFSLIILIRVLDFFLMCNTRIMCLRRVMSSMQRMPSLFASKAILLFCWPFSFFVSFKRGRLKVAFRAYVPLAMFFLRWFSVL